MSDTKKCPYCDEEIKARAIKCKHCQSMLEFEKDLNIDQKTLDADETGKNTPKEVEFTKTGKKTLLYVFIGSVVFIIFILLLSPVDDQNGDEYVYEQVDENGDQYGEINGWEFKRMAIPVGENPPHPDEVGVVGVEPGGRALIKGNDLANFGRRWNDIVYDLGQTDLLLQELNLSYQRPGVDAKYDFEDWLRVYIMICYDTGYLEITAIDWNYVPEIDGQMIAAAWVALIYATIPDLGSDDLVYILNSLGILNLSPDEMRDYSLEKTIGDYTYRFYSTDSWGDFEIEHKDW